MHGILTPQRKVGISHQTKPIELHYALYGYPAYIFACYSDHFDTNLFILPHTG
jgi:hypothetical protein